MTCLINTRTKKIFKDVFTFIKDLPIIIVLSFLFIFAGIGVLYDVIKETNTTIRSKKDGKV